MSYRAEDTPAVPSMSTIPGLVPVGLVKDQPADGAEGDAQRVPDVVDQATRRGDQDVDALTQPEDRK